MGRPKKTDKIKQITVGLRQSVVDKYGYENLQDQIKQFLTRFE